MTVSLALVVLGLALLDTTSFGTSLVPLWLLLAPGRVRPARMMAYLFTLTVAYFLAGILLALGADRLLDAIGTLLDAAPPTAVEIGWLLIGVALVVTACLVLARARARRAQPVSGRLGRWRDDAMTDPRSSAGLIRLAMIAFTLEVATMVPYLAAIGLLTRADIGWPATIAWLAIYCLVMVIPAAALTLVRVYAHERIDPFLRHLSDWLARNSTTTAGITLGLIGIVITIDATTILAT
ncbi:GAP family protein [Brevibacterium sp. FME17]|uniref:GAP family protein n=1 Tax=Brevibacterium sp. FME17 TaxID=2742606 RepID=UPI0018681B8D|nr:GAP family protein [Brevibacterium sp. FME17]